MACRLGIEGVNAALDGGSNAQFSTSVTTIGRNDLKCIDITDNVSH